MSGGLSAIILAGGRGTRLAGLYPDLPKPLVPVRGQPFLHWLTLWLLRQGVKDFVFSVGYRADQIADWAKATPLLKESRVEIVPEATPLGTGGGVCACLPFCGENLLVTNGDSLILTDMAEALRAFQNQAQPDGLLVGKTVDDTSRYASLQVDPDGHLIAYREKMPGKGLISAGVYAFRKSLLQPFATGQALSMEYDIMPKLLADGRVIQIVRTSEDAPFIDIGTPETAHQADAFVREHFPVD